MGGCVSSGVTKKAAAAAATGKLVHEDGRMHEFGFPVKVAEVLRQQPATDAFFVCDADSMFSGELLSAVSTGQVLKLGQLYFLLPLSMLRRPLRSQDMVDLALKASSAAPCGGRGPSAVVPFDFPETLTSGERPVVVEQRSCRRREVRGNGGRTHFALNLSVITEFEEEEMEEMIC